MEREAAEKSIVETVTLKVKQYCVSQRLNPEMFRCDAQYDYIADAIIVRLTRDIATERMERHTYPTTWLDAVKDRFFPDWALRRWPVHYTVVEAVALYPEVALPTRRPVIKIHKHNLCASRDRLLTGRWD